jgi:hypothetical protein
MSAAAYANVADSAGFEAQTAVASTKFDYNDHQATINGVTIPFSEITQIIFNRATDAEGGSAYIQTLPRRNNPYANAAVFNVTFNSPNLNKAIAFVGKANEWGVPTRIVHGDDKLFRDMFFIR